MRTLVVIEKTSTSTSPQKVPASGQSEGEEGSGSISKEGNQKAALTLSYYLSSHLPQKAETFEAWVRGHWGGCEIRNHWVRDALWREDDTRSKNKNLNGNLAVLRSALIALKSRVNPESPWPSLFEQCSSKSSIAYNMIAKNRFK